MIHKIDQKLEAELIPNKKNEADAKNKDAWAVYYMPWKYMRVVDINFLIKNI